jgi:hypothetical protein
LAVRAPIHSADFEAPTFTSGPIATQDGWFDTGTVQSGVVSSGTRALEATSSTTFVQAYFVQAYRPPNVPAAGTISTILPDARRSAATDAPSSTVIFGDTGFIGQVIGGSTGIGIGSYCDATAVLPGPNDFRLHLVFTLDFTTLTMSASANAVPLGTLPIDNPVLPTIITDFSLGAFFLGDVAKRLHRRSRHHGGARACVARLLGLGLAAVSRLRRY